MILNYVKIEVRTQTAEVQWIDVDEVSEKPMRCHTYSEGNKAEFLAEVDNAESYLPALGWQ